MKKWLTFIFLVAVSLNAQVPSDNYELVWEDEFEGEYLNANNWNYRSLGPRRDALNVRRCATVQKGLLALRTEEKNDSVYSVMLSTQNKYETTYGYFEVKCLLPRVTGHWSAFWLQTPIMGEYIGEPDKAGAEIDIFEYFPNKPKQIHHTLHYDGYEEHHKVKHKIVKHKRFTKNNWHTFGLEWTPDSYTYYIDGEAQFTVKEGVSQRDQYILLSLEVGEQAGKMHKNTLPDYFIVDYVKVYKVK